MVGITQKEVKVIVKLLRREKAIYRISTHIGTRESNINIEIIKGYVQESALLFKTDNIKDYKYHRGRTLLNTALKVYENDIRPQTKNHIFSLK